MLSLHTAINGELHAYNLKEMLAEAEAIVPTVSPAEALEMMRSAEVLTLDVREPFETEKTGMIKGAINIPRGLLELTADTDGPHYDPTFEKHRIVLVYCTAGFRSTAVPRSSGH
ncbi:rhodanese-like domain-containing protein [Pseudomonas chlororaphis]|uniref:rhodanese-like domain-containing protein n=1 Tax=Pseudomonas chlororaphis TaxID=587753 RepID=UPI000F57361E|nr:rhodanese-like domain-containing protein [Pseudomonas chlororaphis]